MGNVNSVLGKTVASLTTAFSFAYCEGFSDITGSFILTRDYVSEDNAFCVFVRFCFFFILESRCNCYSGKLCGAGVNPLIYLFSVYKNTGVTYTVVLIDLVITNIWHLMDMNKKHYFKTGEALTCDVNH